MPAVSLVRIDDATRCPPPASGQQLRRGRRILRRYAAPIFERVPPTLRDIYEAPRHLMPSIYGYRNSTYERTNDSTHWARALCLNNPTVAPGQRERSSVLDHGEYLRALSSVDFGRPDLPAIRTSRTRSDGREGREGVPVARAGVDVDGALALATASGDFLPALNRLDLSVCRPEVVVRERNARWLQPPVPRVGVGSHSRSLTPQPTNGAPAAGSRCRRRVDNDPAVLGLRRIGCQDQSRAVSE